MSKKKPRRGAERTVPLARPAANVVPLSARSGVRNRGLLAAIAALLIVAGAGIWWSRVGGQASRSSNASIAVSATYAGGQACAECHAEQSKAWMGSDHQLAMQPATAQTVLGSFDNSHFSYAGTISTFFKRGDKFFVRTDGADGKLADFEIRYTFGVRPLQQYLIEFADGRLQALSIVWDARTKASGGQRWYHLYPKDNIKAGDALHWTGLQQNWNFMCAECHSTNLLRNYGEASNTFKTSWTDINVSCEACHGPGSAHIEWARRKAGGADNGLLVHFDERSNIRWSIDAATGNASRSAPRTTGKEIETCAYCHARRAQIWEPHVPGRPLAQTHLPALLTAGLYEADGQMRDEVYNYGSFLQSKMNARGVTCSDCHDPHSDLLRASGADVCAQCHRAEKYAAREHSHHANGRVRCPECHMPARIYMGIDKRHDHSFRVPRPDQSATLGTPNACNDCHTEKNAQWAAAAIERWYGNQRKGFQTFGRALHAARGGLPEARALLLQMISEASQPAIARATAFQELAPYLTQSFIPEMQRGLSDPDPLVRLAASRAFSGLPPESRVGPLHALLDDPVRSVRMEALSSLMQVPASLLSPEQRTALDKVAQEYIAVQRLNADRPEAHLNLGLLYAARGNAAAAEAQYHKALALDPQFAQATVNLADLYRSQNRDADGERVLRDALALEPREASVHHALGLLLVRQGRQHDALAELAGAVRLDPSSARYSYVYAIALDSTGRRKEALKALEKNHRAHPADRDTLLALVTINRDLGQNQLALDWLQALEKSAPGEASTRQLARELRAQ